MFRRTAPALLLGLDLAGLRVLHGLGDRPWAHLTTTSAPEDAVVALVRLAAMALGWWLVATTVLYGLTRLAGAGRLSLAVGRVTLPLARRLVDGALLATLTLGPALPAAAARPLPPPLMVQDAADDPVPVLPPIVAPPRDDTTTRPSAPPPPLPAPVDPAPGMEPGRRHVVARGEHLWGIAAKTVGEAPPGEVARYWRALVTTNRDRLRSGDPDLVHPGEVLVLPPIERGTGG